KSASGDDPARKYCLTKLEEIFCPIFFRHPFLDGKKATSGNLEPTKQEDLTDEEKEKLEMTAKHFAADLEQCIFNLYSDTDKNGKHFVGSKYKERFRMLTFNLSKPDRVLLHKRIASSSLAPNELSTMTSTELADEETKQSIRHAEEEALAHSILKKQALPRAKIT
ncbi:transcription factor S-II, central domain-containing protein, partial [Fomitopsis serialis]|uniref:transcription factor S-II, central domain-containing protein n=1 Tax=Fomitopsis serialis TaxID=139415 RepID=UPI002007EB3C